MPAEQIATNLALINWTLLTGLAVGSFAVVAFARLTTPATKGYLAFTAACAAGFGVLAYLSDTGLPAVGAGPVPVDPAFDEPRRLALLVFVLLAVVTTIALARGRRAVIPAIAGLVAGLAVIVLGALTWGGSPLGVVPLAIQLAVLAAATGGVFAAMILGHWYLVTPRLPEAPLVMVSRRLLWIVALQMVLFLAWVGFGAVCSATIHSSRRETITSGASGSRGVTRYQWPRIIAANTPPVAAASTASWIASGTAPSGLPPHVRAPSTMTARPATSPAIAGITAARPRASAMRGHHGEHDEDHEREAARLVERRVDRHGGREPMIGSPVSDR